MKHIDEVHGKDKNDNAGSADCVIFVRYLNCSFEIGKSCSDRLDRNKCTLIDWFSIVQYIVQYILALALRKAFTI